MHVFLSALSRFTQPTGICRHSANLVRCLAQSDSVSRITMAAGSWQVGYFREQLGVSSAKVQRVAVDIPNRSVSRNRWFACGLPRLAKEARADLVHLSFPAPVIRRSYQVPVVASIHDLYPFEMPETFGHCDALLKRLIFKQCVHNADGLACVSQTTQNSLARLFPGVTQGTTIALVHNCVELVHFEAQQPDATVNRPFILTVAQHNRNKRLDRLLRAFHNLTSKGALASGTQLVMVGKENTCTNELHTLARELGIEQKIIWLSAIEDSQLAWLYQNCELFVVTSDAEGFCLPLMEALSFSCRVVCTDIPVLRELSQGRCTFFDRNQGAENNLVAAIVSALNVKPSVQRPDRRFSKEAVAEECLSLYSRLLVRPTLNR